MANTPPVHLLLVEDDPVSAAFLCEALFALPATVDHADCLARAHAHANRCGHALWLVDANLPDGSGESWLQQRRRDGDVTPALALTAELSRERLDSLIAAGFCEALQKPLSIASLHSAVQRALGHSPLSAAATRAGKLPVWDEQRALTALGGDTNALAKLRVLFLQELPRQRDTVLAALHAGELEQARSVLHMLKASTAFVGAARLGQATTALSNSLDDVAAKHRFSEAVSDHLSA